MKRDMDLIRKIVFVIEEHDHGRAPHPLEIEGYTEEQIGYHAHIMKEAGLIRAADVTHMMSPSPCAMPTGLTWAGHEFAEAARSDTIWNKTKTKIKEKGLELGSLGFGVLTEYLKLQIKEQLGLK